MNSPRVKSLARHCLLPGLLILTAWLSGCNLVVGDYQTAPAPDGYDRDRDGDAGIPDAGGDPVLQTCTPVAATAGFTILAGPDSACADSHCPGWANLCFADGTRYLLSQTDGQTTRLFNNCWVGQPATSASALTCEAADGASAIIDENRRRENRPTVVINFDAAAGVSWALYHRSVTELALLPPKTGCGRDSCEMFDGFQLDAQHYYFIGMKTDGQQPEIARWFSSCSLLAGQPGTFDEIDCLGDAGRLISLKAAGTDSSSIAFTGVWTFYSETVGGERIKIVNQAAAGCATTSCEMMAGFQIEAGYRDAVRQAGENLVRWFDNCSQDTNPGQAHITCRSGDSHFVDIAAFGPESSDQPLDADSSWTLVRWSLGNR